jgi:hypothetical protein
MGLYLEGPRKVHPIDLRRKKRPLLLVRKLGHLGLMIQIKLQAQITIYLPHFNSKILSCQVAINLNNADFQFKMMVSIKSQALRIILIYCP